MSTPQSKVIVTCAITGSVHTPSMTPHLPITPTQIATSAVEAAAAGAAILHLHVRDPKDGRPSADPTLYFECLEQIKGRTDAVINFTTGGSQDMTVDDRIRAPLIRSPEMASLNLGTMNFALFRKPVGKDSYLTEDMFTVLGSAKDMKGIEEQYSFRHALFDTHALTLMGLPIRSDPTTDARDPRMATARALRAGGMSRQVALHEKS